MPVNQSFNKLHRQTNSQPLDPSVIKDKPRPQKYNRFAQKPGKDRTFLIIQPTGIQQAAAVRQVCRPDRG